MTTKTKPLYVFVFDGSDGSYSTGYTMDSEFVAKLHKAYDEGRLTYDTGGGLLIDGDGFHYDTLNVPESVTAESLGVPMLDAEDFSDLFKDEG